MATGDDPRSVSAPPRPGQTICILSRCAEPRSGALAFMPLATGAVSLVTRGHNGAEAWVSGSDLPSSASQTDSSVVAGGFHRVRQHPRESLPTRLASLVEAQLTGCAQRHDPRGIEARFCAMPHVGVRRSGLSQATCRLPARHNDHSTRLLRPDSGVADSEMTPCDGASRAGGYLLRARAPAEMKRWSRHQTLQTISFL
jgi:hypothetical protein